MLSVKICLISAYVHEIGRGGRDGKAAMAIIHFNNSDIAPNVIGLSDAMRQYCQITTCRREFLCLHFGFETEIDQSHECCEYVKVTAPVQNVTRVSCAECDEGKLCRM